MLDDECRSCFAAIGRPADAAGTAAGAAVAVIPGTVRSVGRNVVSVEATDGHISRLCAAACGMSPRVAVKWVSFAANRPVDARKEVQILTAVIGKPRVVQFLGAYEFTLFGDKMVAIVMPEYRHSLRSLAKNCPPMGNLTALCTEIARDVLNGLAGLHRVGIAHRDVNPANVMIDEKGRCVLIDFGIAIFEGDEPAGQMFHEVGTGKYRAPELLLGARSYAATKLDVWALAMIIVEILGGRTTTPLIDDSSDFSMICGIAKLIGPPDVNTWPEGRAFSALQYFDFSTGSNQLPVLISASSTELIKLCTDVLVYSAAKRPDADALLALFDEKSPPRDIVALWNKR